MALGMQSAKRRIKSVEATKKITNAMQLVSTSKLKKVKDILAGVKVYTDEVMSCVSSIMQSNKDVDSPYLKRNDAEGTLFIVVTSTLGLCGGYNTNILKEVKKVFNKDTDKVIVLGLKGANHFKNRGVTPIYQMIEDSTGKEVELAKTIKDICLKEYASGTISKISLAYTRFVNSVVFQPVIIDLLPIDEEAFGKIELTKDSKETLFEPNANSIIDALIPMYFYSTLYGRLVESHVSEQASRRTAMENATDNASEIIEKLKLQYNKARQSAITQEISEVVAGANS